ncbi:MAG: Fic family protein [Treponema sp.]|nr:Fic family protein [Treponema sp.]
MDIFEADDNSTPLTTEEKDGLKLKWITLRSELNEAEARNIAEAQIWLATNKNKDVLSDSFLRNLHKKMFGNVWKWAGKYRETVRLHHRLVQIHPFPNGNGRVSRIMADLTSFQLEGKALYWGNENLVNVSEIKTRYIAALRKADAGDYSDLLDFTKS